MKIAKINFPVHDNDKNDLSIQADTFRHMLCDTFGGFTETRATGGWKNEQGQLFIEPMRVFEIATEDTPEADAQLVDLALRVGRICRQEAVYCVMPSGAVQFINTAQEWKREPAEAAA